MVEANAASVLAISLLGAVGQAAVTILWYEPPPPKDGSAASETPTPVLEAGVFAVLFWLLFVLIGSVLSAIAAIAPPFSRIGLLVLTPLGGYVAYAAATGRVEGYADRAPTMMWGVGGLVVAAYPLAFLVA